MKKLILSVLIVIASFGAVNAQTVINDRAAKAKLLGKHRLSLQWVSWDYFGSSVVREKNGILYIKGTQRGRGKSKNDFVTIDGVITEVSAKEFVFDGKITTSVSYINDGEPCERDGETTFKVTGNRRYWRMQNMLNPCTNVETDYVDVYFR